MTPLAAYILLFLGVGVGFIFVHLLAGKLIRPNRPDAEKGTIYECGEPTIGSAWIQFDLRFYVVALLFVIFDVEVAFFFPWAEVFGKANALAAQKRPESAKDCNEYARKVLDLLPPPTNASQRQERARYEALRDLTDEDLARLKNLSEAQRNALLKLDPGDLPLLMRPRPNQARLETKLDAGELAALRRIDEDTLRLIQKLSLDALRSELPMREGVFAQNQATARSLGWLAFVELLVFFGVLLVGFAYLWRRGDLAWVRSVAAEQPAVPPAPAPAAQPRELTGAGTGS
jgi:NADH:ubiquinone oxidoreductase subunit 3 (subunit A)